MPFGHGVDIVVNRNNTAERIYGVGDRNATSSIKKQYDSRVTVNGALSNAYWFLGILGANADGGVSGAYTHTYTETNSVPSFTIKTGFELGTTDFGAELVGTKIETATINATVNEAVRFTLDCSYRYENLSTTAIADNPEVEPVFTFVHGSLDLPDGTTLAAVQSIELTFNNTAESLYEVGTRFKRDNVAKQREYNFTFNLAFNDPADVLNYFMNGTSSATAPEDASTEVATLTLTFTNDDDDSLVFTFTGITLNEDSLTQNVGEIVKENVTGWARGCTSVVYTNDVQTAPAEATN